MRTKFLRLGAMVVAVAAVISTSVVVSAATTLDGRNSHVRGLVLFVGDSNLTLSTYAIESALASSPRGDNGFVSATLADRFHHPHVRLPRPDRLCDDGLLAVQSRRAPPEGEP